MSLHSTELSKLAKALAKAFPDYKERMRLEAKAEVVAKAQVTGDSLEAWRDIVHCSQQAGHLQVLIDAALLEQPNNPDLKRFQLVDETSPDRFSAGHLWVAGALLIGGGVAFFFGSGLDGDEGDSHSNDVEEQAASTVPDIPPPQGSDVTNEGVAALQEEPVFDVKPGAAPVVQPSVDSVPVKVELAVPSSEGAVTGRCGGERGALVGYFYAGEGIGALVGEAYQMRGDVNVRQDYPHRENAWSFREPIVCVLKKGDTVVLTKSAFDVDGGKVWVPLYAGDLQSM